MNKTENIDDEVVDLFLIFKILWDNKYKIILSTIIVASLGITYSLQKQNLFLVNSPIQSGKASVFIEFKPINDVLRENKLLLSEENLNGYLIDSSTIFQTFLDEFNDYEEMITVLKNDKYIKNLIEEIEPENKQRALIGFAKSFYIKSESNTEQNSIMAKLLTQNISSTLSFEWHDVQDGSRLFEQGLMLTLNNVKTTLINDIDKLASSIDLKNQRELENLRIELSIIQQKQELDNARRIQYLVEQASIAEELEIENNNFDANTLATINSSNFPFYLRGYKAINKEIKIIQNRSKEEQLLMAKGYDEINKKILSLENDLSSYQLRSFLKAIENDNPSDWIEFDLALADSKSQSNSRIFIIWSIIFGIIIGVFVALTSHSISRRINN